MSILSDEQRDALLKAGRAAQEAETSGKDCHLPPVVLLRLSGFPSSAWMLAYVTPGDPDLAYGLMEVSGGNPELGFVRLSELEALRGYQDKGIRHDSMFEKAAKLDISEYAEMARDLGQIALQFNAPAVDDHAEIMRELERRAERKARKAKKKAGREAPK